MIYIYAYALMNKQEDVAFFVVIYIFIYIYSYPSLQHTRVNYALVSIWYRSYPDSSRDYTHNNYHYFGDDFNCYDLE